MIKLLILITLLLTSCSNSDDKIATDAINVFAARNKTLKTNVLIADLDFKDKFKLSFVNSNNANNRGNLIFPALNNKKLKKHKHRFSKKEAELPFLISPLTSDENIILPTNSKGIFSYNHITKTSNWENKLNSQKDIYNHLNGGIAEYKNIIFFTNGSKSIYALNQKNGEILWYKSFSSIIKSKPFIHKDKLFITSLDNNIYALTAKKGRIVWKTPLDNNLTSLYGSPSFNISKNGMLITGDYSGKLISLNPKNGKIIWQDNIGKTSLSDFDFADIDATPVIYNEDIIAVSNNGVLASHKAVSALKNWEIKISSNKTPWVTNKLIFVIDDKNNLIALTRNYGKIKWFINLHKLSKDKHKEFIFSSPIVIEGQVAVLNNQGKLFFLDFNTGSTIKKQKIPKEIHHTPVIDNGKMFLITNQGKLYIYN